MHALGLHPADRTVLPVMAMTMDFMVTAHPATGPIAMPIHKELQSIEEILYSGGHFAREARKVKRVCHADKRAGHQNFPGWKRFFNMAP